MVRRSVYRWGLIACAVLFSQLALADTSPLADPDLRPDGLAMSFDRDVSRTHISLGFELTNLTSLTDSAIGIGPRFGFEYGLTDKWSLAADFAFAFEATGQPGSFFYSGLNGTVHYSLVGSSVLATSHIKKAEGTEIFTSVPSAKRRITAMLGVEQLFLNGTSSIYPAVGYLIGGTCSFSMFTREFQFDLRYSSLTANDNPITMIGLSLGMNLTL